MKKAMSLLAGFLFVAVAGVTQQAKPTIVAEGGAPDERASARVLYWNTKADAAAGQFAINYGRPVWKKDYEDPAKFDAITKGKTWRMGSNFWTALVTDLPLKIGGQSVRPGTYFLGLHCSAEGSSWSLAFIDPVAVRRAHLDAFDIRKASTMFEAPMSVAKAEGKVDKLTITLSYSKENIRNVTMKVAWGNLALTAPIEVSVQE